MPTYDFLCVNCGREREVFMSLSEKQVRLPTCDCAGRPVLRQVFRACNILGDEIKSTRYFHPTKGHEVRDHGRVFDEGLGEWYGTKSERRALMRQHGLREYGGADPHNLTDTVYEKFYKSRQEGT